MSSSSDHPPTRTTTTTSSSSTSTTTKRRNNPSSTSVIAIADRTITTTSFWGKPSLRKRLEAYYSLVAPTLLANENNEWNDRFEQIWSKYGGTADGEKKLAKKLASKYGITVRLLLIQPPSSNQSESTNQATKHDGSDIIDDDNNTDGDPSTKDDERWTEEWFQLTDDEINSTSVDFTSSNFNPHHALGSPTTVYTTNPWITQCPLLDRVHQCRQYLYKHDPLYCEPASLNTRKSNQQPKSNNTTETTDSTSSYELLRKNKVPSSFASIASVHSTGPLSILYKALISRTRIRIVIRYVNGIRGIMTGHIIAFDKHMNIILRDITENYTPRFPTTNDNSNNNNDEDEDDSSFIINDDETNLPTVLSVQHSIATPQSAVLGSDDTTVLSNVEIELQRRQIPWISCPKQISSIETSKSTTRSNFQSSSESVIISDNNQQQQQQQIPTTTSRWNIRQRYLGQVLVRGDMIVMIYNADQEQSMWPVTKKSPTKSRYRAKRNIKIVPTEQRIGTPGSLILAYHQQQQKQKQKEQTSSTQVYT